MALRKQVGSQNPEITSATVVSPSSGDHHPPFLTLEETTTATAADTTQSLLQQHHGDLISNDSERTRKRALHNMTSNNNNINASNQTGALPAGSEDEKEALLNESSFHRHAESDNDNEDFDDDDDKNKKKKHSKRKPTTVSTQSKSSPFSIKKLISYAMFALLFCIIWDALFTPPERRWIQPTHTDVFLQWVQQHPLQGLVAIVLVIAAAVVVLIPIGTPLTLGCGYIYKGAYGWKLGLTIATLVSMGGSALGAVICFLLGRYLFREQVRTWARNKYPLFDAIDVAASQHGLRIMAMLYLTPILPLGPVAYMCGTTSMALSSFVIAKVASLPLMLLYCFIGASTRTLISAGGSAAASDELKSIEENETLIISGIVLSLVMIAGITTYIRKELNTILERQEKHKPGEQELTSVGGGGAAAGTSNTGGTLENENSADDDAIELGGAGRTVTARRRAA